MKNQIINKETIITEFLKDIKDFFDDEDNFDIASVRYVARKKYLKREYNFDKLFDDTLRKNIEENLTNYVNDIYVEYKLKVSLSKNCVYVCNFDKYITKSTLIKAWGKHLFEKYADEPDIISETRKYGKKTDLYLYGMTKIRRIEASSTFQHDWLNYRTISFRDRYKGFEETNYKPF